MQFWKLLFSSLLLPISSLAQASENRSDPRQDLVEHATSAALCLQQASDDGLIDWLPQDIVLSQLGRRLLELESHGVWLPEGEGKRWTAVAKIVEAMEAFRDGESSVEDIVAMLEVKEQIKEGLLLALSAQWKESLEKLIEEQGQDRDKWSTGRAYGAGFLAYYMIELTATLDAANNAAWEGAWGAAFYAARDAAWNHTWTNARIAALFSSRSAAWYAFLSSVQSAVEEKLKILAHKNADELGVIAYDLGELVALLWLTEHGHGYLKTAFDAAYAEIPDNLTIEKAKAIIYGAIGTENLEKNPHIVALKRDLETLETFFRR